MDGAGPRRGADHTVMREVNRSLVLTVVREGGRVSRASLARATTLAKPTVSAIVDELIADGLVREVGPGVTAVSGGRPPILLEFNASSHLVVGAHIGARRTTVAVGDANGHEVARREFDTADGEPEAVLREVAAQATLAVGATVPGGRIAAVGVVLPGLTDFHRGVCLLAPNLGWYDVPVAEVLTAVLDVPVYVHNAGQAAAVAENLEGVGDKVGDLALLYVGTGLSAGVLSAGRVFHGTGGTAGEIGHCRMPGNAEQCNCGNVGCLETVASGPAMVRFAREAIAAGRVSALGDGFDARAVAAAARSGDAVAAEAVAEVGGNLGLAASWVINAYNPAMLVLGGGLAAISDLLLPHLRDAATEYALGAARRGVEIQVSKLGRDAEVRGAVLLALQHSETYYRVVFRA
ncbi:ROK family transcriptional regulator [Micromonospora sp. Llam7]|uniref:ROK family transcriptional regulator n=1 Tax=Micromonospora tarapacensis TaxID=2835305 RepID=UPI001C83AAC9|nr:ROK family transcriptional regulator [Micromonospora tarapacensis]MBX7266605.1 ROK family transcriptional regulator [Micromonospora tarapacensis]